ncbi:hypothetical protein AB0C27_55880 [Nonomuraea sp. NPDC048882]|uniref:hypothetical protein n=1 Tax=Nonomuraea sp. NPDC048882 TaxID=3154347 RepID=UPI0033D3F643
MSFEGGARKVSQRADASGFARIYQTAGDMVVYEGEEPYRLAAWPAPAAPPLTREARIQPSVLLRAANAVIDFTGRQATLAELRDWRDGDAQEGVAVHLIHGPGGQGKTRLAGHVAELWRREGWVVLAAHHRRDRSAPDAFIVPDVAAAVGVLVVVDYAERWDTADLLSLLADTQIRRGLPVRVLLLARPAGTWWQSLEYRIQRDRHLVPSLRELAPLDQDASVTRCGLFEAARDRFAELLEVLDARNIEPPLTLEGHEAYRLVLTVHMAALAAVLAHDRGQPAPGDPVRVSECLLARERDHWKAMGNSHLEMPLLTSPDAMAQVVYTATMTGRLPYADGKAALRQADIDSGHAVGQLLKDHALCYPPSTTNPSGRTPHKAESPLRAQATVLEPLYPDRLGEDFLALSTPGHTYDFPADSWAAEALARLLVPIADRGETLAEGDGVPVWTRHGLITLIEAAHRWPHLAEQLFALVASHPHLALRAGGTALASLVDLPGVEPALLEAIESVLPAHRHIELDIGIAAVSARLAKHRLATSTNPAWARTCEALAIRLSNAMLHSQALVAGNLSTQRWQQLAEADRKTWLPDFAASLSNHAVRLLKVGRQDEAISIAKQAADSFAELAEADRKTWLPDLAGSLNVYAALLAGVERQDEAVSISKQAIDLYEEVTAENGDFHRPDLASLLNNHASRLKEAGRRDEAILVSQRAVSLLESLVEVS